MKHTFKFIIILILGIAVISSCNKNNVSEKKQIHDTVSTTVDESDALLSFFENTGNFINDDAIPTMVTVDDVFRNLNKYLIIDIRDHASYVNGHIDGAVNVQKEDVFDYMKNKVSASNYDKIVFVCYTNQNASYVTMMFRLLGYGNAYSMKYGMSACDAATAENKWWKAISSKYVSQLETKENPRNKKSKEYPKINTGKTNPYNILEEQVKKTITKQFIIKADDVFSDSEKYYIVNYWPEDHYNLGHIPGAHQYTPKKSLVRITHLSTLPTDKPILVYCYTGQHAAFISAYLNILGYDAYSLAYAANGFMYSKLKSAGIGHAYDKAVNFKSYPLVKGELPSIKTDTVVNDQEETEKDNTPEMPVIVNTKKEEGGGC